MGFSVVPFVHMFLYMFTLLLFVVVIVLLVAQPFGFFKVFIAE